MEIRLMSFRWRQKSLTHQARIKVRPRRGISAAAPVMNACFLWHNVWLRSVDVYAFVSRTNDEENKIRPKSFFYVRQSKK